jgi:hypothetical protein
MNIKLLGLLLGVPFVSIVSARPRVYAREAPPGGSSVANSLASVALLSRRPPLRDPRAGAAISSPPMPRVEVVRIEDGAEIRREARESNAVRRSRRLSWCRSTGLSA